MMRQYIIMNVTFSVSAFLDRVGVDQTSLARLLDDAGFRTSDLSTVAGTMQYLGRLLECALELRDLASNNRYDYSIEKACEYISTHFASEDISLNSVAKSVNLSPAHFSSIFSRNMGKTFTEYLTEIRMERARELLLFSTKRSSEVAYEIGFRDPHYFSYVFKKMYGCSPREFRSTGKE
jgi:two-component system response regulator YesN